MHIKFLVYLACPNCKGDLFIESGEKKTIIFISLNYAQKNTLNNSNSLVKEVKILCIHGILHLLGYNHSNKKSEKVMFLCSFRLFLKDLSGKAKKRNCILWSLVFSEKRKRKVPPVSAPFGAMKVKSFV